jgi:uncharacterized phage-associated protein
MDLSVPSGFVGVVRFDYKKALESILYVCSKLKAPTIHDVSKLLYWADKYHLQHYGRQLFDDTYIAMKHGPVPSGCYDMIKSVRGDGIFAFSDDVTASFKVIENHRVEINREPNLKYLSKSEIAALDFSVKKYGALSFTDKTKESHDSAWQEAQRDDSMSLESIIKTLPNSEELWSYISSK